MKATKQKSIINKGPIQKHYHIRCRNEPTTKTGLLSDKAKARPIPLHLQDAVGKELEKLTKSGHLE